jgi:hypothetical protein
LGLNNTIYQLDKYLLIIFILLSLKMIAADNEIYVDQSGATANIDLEQLGSGNIIGGASAIAGTMTPLDLDGTSLTLDINQIGNTNKFLGDIYADNYTGFFEFTGDTNTFNMQTDPTNTYGADSSDVNVQVTGSGNTFTLNHSVAALASTLDLDWTIQGSNNTITASIDYDSAINFMDIDGSDNTVTLMQMVLQGDIFTLTIQAEVEHSTYNNKAP